MQANASAFRWSRKTERAALLVSQDELPDKAIAAEVGVNESTLERWKRFPEFRDRVQEHRDLWREQIKAKGIAERQNRIDALNERWNLMREVIDGRAEDSRMQHVAGGRTGLLVHTVKGVGRGEDFQLIDLYEVDTGLLNELRRKSSESGPRSAKSAGREGRPSRFVPAITEKGFPRSCHPRMTTMSRIVLDRVPMLRPDQARIARHPAKRKAVCMGRRWGKTVLGLVLVLSTVLIGQRVAWLVPNYRNSSPFWRALEAALAPLQKAGKARFNKAERFIELWNGGFVGVYTADNAAAMRGEWFHLVVTDEAARVKEDVIEEVVEPTLADVDGDHIAISTPLGKNWFWRMWRRGMEDGQETAAFRAPTSDNPIPMIQKAYRRARDRFGEDSNSFRQEWEAEFVDAGAVVWLREWCEERYRLDDAAMDRSVIARFLSYDTASKDKEHNAYSACVVGELLPDYRLRLRHVWRDRLLMPDLVARIERDAERWDDDGKLHEIIIEDRASGIGAYQTIERSGSERVQSLLRAFNPTTSKDERFGNAGVWVKNGSVILPAPCDEARWLHAFEAEVFEEDEFEDQRDAVAQLILWKEPYLAQGFQLRRGVAA
jgi:predicted phage terminase large subunit-like protein